MMKAIFQLLVSQFFSEKNLKDGRFGNEINLRVL